MSAPQNTIHNVIPVKKPATKRTRAPQTQKPFKRLDYTGNANKYRYLRFKFQTPTYEDANGLIEQLYQEKVIDWSYVSSIESKAADEQGGKSFVSTHGILRVPNFTVYDWAWFRARWPYAYFKLGFYPEGSYPRVPKNAAAVQVETQRVGAPLPPAPAPTNDFKEELTLAFETDEEGTI